MPHLQTDKALRLCLLTVSFALFWGGRMCVAGENRSPVVPGPLFREATNEFQTMKTTLYQYRMQVDQAAGDYRYDCVGFVSYALRRATPQAWSTITNIVGTPKGRIPNPIQYRTFLAGLTKKSQPGWTAVTNVADLRLGDVVAWEHQTETAIGHAVIIGSLPVVGQEGEWAVEVYDSTSFPHGDDSRPGDERAQKMADNQRRSGLGRGRLVLLADPVTGALAGLRWSPKAKPVIVPIAAGRPVS